jgi:7,8-dihydropterin-6-yl-methyl-4-(beta-D-ribofuranosyl)aminobenzene 5'-phosphate synthase
VVVGRFFLASSNLAHETGESASSAAFEIGSTKTLTITPLFENAVSNPDLHVEHGVSYLVQTDDQTVLLDLGNNMQNLFPAPLDENMRKLGISAQDLDTLVVSHNHPDHVGGINTWQKGTFAAPGGRTDLSGVGIFLPVNLTYPGVLPTVAEDPVQIGEGIASTGRQPFLNPFPLWIGQPVEQEQSLVVNVDGHGLVIITGCGHPGIEKIIARSESLFGLPVVGVVGGLHYVGLSEEQVIPHLDFIREREPGLVAISPHDSDKDTIELFRSAFPNAYQDIEVGNVISFPKLK